MVVRADTCESPALMAEWKKQRRRCRSCVETAERIGFDDLLCIGPSVNSKARLCCSCFAACFAGRIDRGRKRLDACLRNQKRRFVAKGLAAECRLRCRATESEQRGIILVSVKVDDTNRFQLRVEESDLPIFFAEM